MNVRYFANLQKKNSMSDSDELKNVLGKELYEELSRHTATKQFGDLTDEQFDQVIDYDYHIVMPVSGEYAIGLIGALFHSTDHECDDCQEMIDDFTASLIASIWNTIIDVHGITFT